MPVYFLEAVGKQLVKIGYAKTDAAGRCAEIQRMSPCPLRIIRIQHKNGTLKEEARLHKKFSDLRVWGEWFRLDEEILDYIDGIKGDGRRDTGSQTCLDDVSIYFDRDSVPALIQAAENGGKICFDELADIASRFVGIRNMYAGLSNLVENVGKLIDGSELVVRRGSDGDWSRELNEQILMKSLATVDIATDVIRSASETFNYETQIRSDEELGVNRLGLKQSFERRPRMRRRMLRRRYI